MLLLQPGLKGGVAERAMWERAVVADVHPGDPIRCSVYHIFLLFSNIYTLYLQCESIAFVVLNV